MATVALFACENKNIFPDPTTLPVKALDLDALVYNIRATSDGRMAAIIKTTLDADYDNHSIALIDRYGNYTFSDSFKMTMADEGNIELQISQSGEFFLHDSYNPRSSCNNIKIDQNGHIAYQLHEEGYKYEYTDYNYAEIYTIYTLLDNGDCARLNFITTRTNDEYIISGSYLNIIDKNGVVNNLRYNIETESDFFASKAISFEDKLFLYSKNSDLSASYNITDNHEYYILNLDGSYVNSGCFENPIQYVKYVDGFVYVITTDMYDYDDAEDDTGVYQWVITQMDTSGNIIRTFDTINSYFVLDNITIHDGILMIPGVIAIDYENDVAYGAIFLLDYNTGTVKETITLNYREIEMMPCIISVDNNGEYDIFALGRHGYDDWADFKKDQSMDNGKIYIYHTNDLHNLHLNN